MMFMNEHDIEDACYKYSIGTGNTTPNLWKATQVLVRLRDWTNDNSDGWHSWNKPVNAAKSVIILLDAAKMTYYGGGAVPDISDAELRKALSPIKAFLTRQGVAHSEVIV